MQRLFPSVTALLLASGCAPVPHAPPAPYPPQDAPLHAAACPVDTSGWTAWVNAMPGPNARPTLIVTGKATVPTGGYSFAWRDVRVMESHPVQVAVDLVAIPPAGGAIQAVVTHDVRGEWPINPPVGSVRIGCGGRTLGVISPVETAH